MLHFFQQGHPKILGPEGVNEEMLQAGSCTPVQNSDNIELEVYNIKFQQGHPKVLGRYRIKNVSTRTPESPWPQKGNRRSVISIVFL